MMFLYTKCPPRAINLGFSFYYILKKSLANLKGVIPVKSYLNADVQKL